MTNGITDLTDEELAFWGLPQEDHELTLREEGEPLIYDLEERTARFGEIIILFAKKIPWSPVNNRLIDQLVGAGTSGGGQIIARLTMAFPNRISSTELALAERSRVKRNFFCGWLRWLNLR